MVQGDTRATTTHVHIHVHRGSLVSLLEDVVVDFSCVVSSEALRLELLRPDGTCYGVLTDIQATASTWVHTCTYTTHTHNYVRTGMHAHSFTRTHAHTHTSSSSIFASVTSPSSNLYHLATLEPGGLQGQHQVSHHSATELMAESPTPSEPHPP